MASQDPSCDERMRNTGTHLTLDRARSIHHDKTKYHTQKGGQARQRVDLPIIEQVSHLGSAVHQEETYRCIPI
jgi:hypothetical protein